MSATVADIAPQPGATTSADVPLPSPRVHHAPAGSGRVVWMVGDTYTFLATGAETGGRLAVWEAVIPPGAGPPPHVHHREDEAYYVLEGEVEVTDGDSRFTARAGSFVFIPRGAVHAFRNPTARTSRMLLWVTPAGLEDFFFTAGLPGRPGEPAPPPGPEELARSVAAAPRYGLELRLPPEVLAAAGTP